MSGRELGFANELPVCSILTPATDAAGRTGTWVHLANAVKVRVRFKVNQGNAATILVSLLQAKDSSGTGSKAISNAVPINLVNDYATTDVPVAQAAATTYTTDATTKQKSVEFEFVPESVLDIANGFSWLTLSTGASNAGNITTADVEILSAIKAAFPPSMLV